MRLKLAVVILILLLSVIGCSKEQEEFPVKDTAVQINGIEPIHKDTFVSMYTNDISFSTGVVDINNREKISYAFPIEWSTNIKGDGTIIISDIENISYELTILTEEQFDTLTHEGATIADVYPNLITSLLGNNFEDCVFNELVMADISTECASEQFNTVVKMSSYWDLGSDTFEFPYHLYASHINDNWITVRVYNDYVIDSCVFDKAYRMKSDLDMVYDNSSEDSKYEILDYFYYFDELSKKCTYSFQKFMKYIYYGNITNEEVELSTIKNIGEFPRYYSESDRLTLDQLYTIYNLDSTESYTLSDGSICFSMCGLKDYFEAFYSGDSLAFSPLDGKNNNYSFVFELRNINEPRLDSIEDTLFRKSLAYVYDSSMYSIVTDDMIDLNGHIYTKEFDMETMAFSNQMTSMTKYEVYVSLNDIEYTLPIMQYVIPYGQYELSLTCTLNTGYAIDNKLYLLENCSIEDTNIDEWVNALSGQESLGFSSKVILYKESYNDMSETSLGLIRLIYDGNIGILEKEISYEE